MSDEGVGMPIYIYVLKDPRTNEVRYVGVSVDPQKRLKQHTSISYLRKANNHRASWVKSLLRDGLSPEMEIIDKTDADNWQQCEIGWIAYYRGIGANLVNSTDGGEGKYGYSPSEETRRKISEANRNISEETRRKLSESKRNISEETRRKLSEARRNRPPASEETRRKLSEAGRNISEETRRKLSVAQRNRPPRSEEMRRKISEARKRKVLQYSLTQQFIRCWDSATDAHKQGVAKRSSIKACCRYKRKSAGGYIWRYADDPLPESDAHQLSLFDDADEE